MTSKLSIMRKQCNTTKQSQLFNSYMMKEQLRFIVDGWMYKVAHLLPKGESSQNGIPNFHKTWGRISVLTYDLRGDRTHLPKIKF